MPAIPNSYTSTEQLEGLYGRVFGDKVPTLVQVTSIAQIVSKEIDAMAGVWYMMPITQAANPLSWDRLAYGNAIGSLSHIHNLEYAYSRDTGENPWAESWQEWLKSLGRSSLPDAAPRQLVTQQTWGQRVEAWARAFFAAHAEANPADVNAAVAAIRAALHEWTFLTGGPIPGNAIQDDGTIQSIADDRINEQVKGYALEDQTSYPAAQDIAANPQVGQVPKAQSDGSVAWADDEQGSGGGTAPAEWAEEGNLDDIPDGKIPPIAYSTLTGRPVILTETDVNARIETLVQAFARAAIASSATNDIIRITNTGTLEGVTFQSLFAAAEPRTGDLRYHAGSPSLVQRYDGAAWQDVAAMGGLDEAEVDARVVEGVKPKALKDAGKFVTPADYVLPKVLDSLERQIDEGGWEVRTLQTQVAAIATGIYQDVNTVFGLAYSDTGPSIGARPDAVRYQYFRIADALDGDPDLAKYQLKFGDSDEALTLPVGAAVQVTGGGGQTVIGGYRYYYLQLEADSIPAGSAIRLQYDEPFRISAEAVRPKEGDLRFDDASPSDIERWTGTAWADVPAHSPVGSIIHNVVGSANIAISARSWYRTGINLPSDLTSKIFAVDFGGESSQMGFFYGASLPDVRTTSSPSATGSSMPFVVRTGEAQAQRIFYLARDNFEVLLASDNDDADATPLRVFEYSVAGAAQAPSATEDVGTAAAVNFTADLTFVDSGLFFPVDYATSIFKLRMGSLRVQMMEFYGGDLNPSQSIGGTASRTGDLAIGFRSPTQRPSGNQNYFFATDANRRVLVARFDGNSPNITNMTLWKVA